MMMPILMISFISAPKDAEAVDDGHARLFNTAVVDDKIKRRLLTYAHEERMHGIALMAHRR